MHAFKSKKLLHLLISLYFCWLLFFRVSFQGSYRAPPYSPRSLKNQTNLDSWLISSIFYCSKLHLSILKLNLLAFIFYSLLASISIFKSPPKCPSYGISPDYFLSPKYCLFIPAQHTMCIYLQYVLKTILSGIISIVCIIHIKQNRGAWHFKRIITCLSAAIICG